MENDYLTDTFPEKICMRAGLKFGHDKGKVFIFVKALYGLKSSGVAFRAFIAEQLEEMRLKSSIAYPDVCIRPVTKPYGAQYYEYILMCIDNLMKISQDVASVIS